MESPVSFLVIAGGDSEALSRSLAATMEAGCAPGLEPAVTKLSLSARIGSIWNRKYETDGQVVLGSRLIGEKILSLPFGLESSGRGLVITRER
jgi:hypothetical protein